MLFGPDKFRLGLPFVKARDQDDFVLVNRAAIRLPDDDLKELKALLYSTDGDHRSVAFWCVLCVLRLRLVRFAIRVCVLGVCVLGVFWFGAFCRISGSRVVRSAFSGPLRRVFCACWGCFSGPAFAFWNLRLA